MLRALFDPRGEMSLKDFMLGIVSLSVIFLLLTSAIGYLLFKADSTEFFGWILSLFKTVSLYCIACLYMKRLRAFEWPLLAVLPILIAHYTATLTLFNFIADFTGPAPFIWINTRTIMDAGLLDMILLLAPITILTCCIELTIGLIFNILISKMKKRLFKSAL